VLSVVVRFITARAIDLKLCTYYVPLGHMTYQTKLCIVLYRLQFVSCHIVSYRTVLPEEIQYEPQIVCTVRGLPYMYVLYCRPIAHGIVSYRIVSYRINYHVVLVRSADDMI
jgi:hypothetical protein